MTSWQHWLPINFPPVIHYLPPESNIDCLQHRQRPQSLFLHEWVSLANGRACVPAGLVQGFIESTCLWRWREASGGDYACNNCDSLISQHGSGVVHSGGPSWNPGASNISPPYERKVRDVSKKDGKLHWKVWYLVNKMVPKRSFR